MDSFVLIFKEVNVLNHFLLSSDHFLSVLPIIDLNCINIVHAVFNTVGNINGAGNISTTFKSNKFRPDEQFASDLC
jgi:hypothetical protein